MQRLYGLILLTICYGLVVGQNYNMTNGTFYTCSGLFADSGGPGLPPYSNNEDYIMTLCPIDPEDKIVLEFFGFNIQPNADYLYIFDGPDTSSSLFGGFTGAGLNNSPGTAMATPENLTGCLTIRFTSDASDTRPGWQANISCFTPCQDIMAVLNSTTPPAQGDGVIRVCQGTSVTFSGSATFSKDGTGATYVWDLDNGITANGQTVTRTFNTPGVSLVNLIVTDNKGCQNDNKLNQVVHVSTTPRFTGTVPSSGTICLGQTATIPGIVTPTPFQYDCTPPVSGITFLPDGNGASYFTSITVDCFNSDMTITSGNTQIQSVCLNMEHSYLGDLSIVLRCPSGKTVPFINHAGNLGGGTILGNPVAWDLPVDANSTNTTPGIGMTYCFSPFATGANNYIDNSSNWETLTPYVDPIGNVSASVSRVRPGTFRAVGNWNNFNGCPLNGNWTIRVTDNLWQDNGYIFWWGMTLAPGIVPAEYSFTPTVATQSWDASPSIVNTSGNTITVQPTTPGSHCYTYRMTDNFNCSYDTTVCVNVNPGPFAGVSNSLTTCSTGPSVNLFSLLGSGVSTTGTWSGPSALGGGHLGTLNPASASSGTYTYSVTGSPPCSLSTATVDVTIGSSFPVSVNVGASQNPICTGTSVTFTATPTNGGPTPSYQWLLNGNPVGTDSPTFTTSSLANGDQVRVTLTNSDPCATGSPANSSTVTMTVNPSLPASVTISPSANPVCAGTNVTFTATPTNGGAAPSYQWLLNGNPVGSNSPTYSNASLSNNDQVRVQMTSNANCVTGSPALSNTETMTINPALPASVSISSSENPICSGISVTFTATPTNGGPAPSYQWLLNGNPVGSNSPTYSNASLSNNDQVRVQMTSNANCATGSPALSNTETMTVNSTLPASVSISPSANPVCQGANVTFTATPTNGGASPTYQWLLNGNPVGSNSPTYNNSSLNDGDQLNVLLTSNANCVTGNPAISDAVLMEVNPSFPTSVSILADLNPVCTGTNVTFVASAVNGGTTPSYQWYINGNPVGSNDESFNSAALNDGDQVQVQLNSSNACTTGNPALSNIIDMQVFTILPVSVSIVESVNPICSGTDVTFTASPVNGGASPSYQWLLNGNPVGSDSPSYSNSALNDGDVVSVMLTSDIPCATDNPATSNTVTITVNPDLPASVSIAASDNGICEGTPVTFTATPINGGTPSYQWLLNGNPVGSDSPTYNNSSLANGDQVRVSMISNATCVTGSPALSNTIDMSVSTPQLVSVSIDVDQNPICDGTSVTFTATPVNGGAAPAYQWLLNGNPVGSDSPSFSISSLSDGDQVRVSMTSNAACVSGNPALSNAVDMAVNTLLPVSVSISPSANPICEGTSVTFTATPVNGGATPAYQWLLNGNPVGSDSPSFSSNSLADGDQVSVRLTSSVGCASDNPATSGAVTMTVNPNLPASVSIAASDNGICEGTPVTFTATPVNGGTPSYQWLLNGNPVGSDSPTYNNSSLANGDQVRVSMTSNAICVTGSPALSNTIDMSVSTPQVVSVSIGVDQNPICASTSVTFTATPVNGGAAPAYQWLINGNPVGGNNPSFSSSSLADGDEVRVSMTSNAACVSGNPALSNAVDMAVNTLLPVSVSISPSANPICEGTSVTFTAMPVNGGATPAYQWLLNGSPVGSDSPSYSNSSLSDGDQVSVRLTSSVGCASDNPATSGAVTMTVNPNLPASVSIAASDNGICEGTPVTITATPVNGGTPSYQWLLNGNPVGSDSPTYNNSSLANGDQVRVSMTSNATCVTGSPALSNTIDLSVSTPQVVSVSIGVDQNPICDGTSVTFTATPVNGGAAPAYQWLLNGNPVGGNNPSFSSSSLADGDEVRVSMTSNAACVSGNPALSNAVDMAVNTLLPVSVSISPSANPICEGTSVTFTATPVNGGATPAYQWLLNGNPVGSNSPSYSNSSLSDGDQVSVRLTSSAVCASDNPAMSSAVSMTVNDYPVFDLGPDLELCEGTAYTLEVLVVADTYDWSTGENATSISVTTSDIYGVTVTRNGCSTSDDILIAFDLEGPTTFNLAPSITICEGENILISVPAEPGTTFTWQDGSTGNSFSVSEAGLYTVTASNQCGNWVESFEVITDPCIICGVFVPTAFTPNKDGTNDMFFPLTNCHDDIIPYRFSVYNRWNELIFDTSLPGTGWDGTYKGKDQPVDSYIYFVSYFNPNLNRTIIHKGFVSLLR